MEAFYLTDTGIVRDHNEDSVIIVTNDSNATLIAVADGMGGHKAGEVASSIAINSLSKKFNETFHNLGKAAAVEWIKTAVNDVNEEIFDYTKKNPESEGMGTTLVMAIVTSDYILFGNIGDSSGYVMKSNVLHKVTKDHTLVNLLLDAGELTLEEAKNHPKKNILMNALGINDPIEIDIFDCNMEIDDIMLCSDGLTTMVSDETIEKVMLEDLTAAEKVVKLIKKANNRGGADNISVAYFKKDKGSVA